MAHSQMKRVGVTGATGHLGHLAMAELQRCGYETIAISRRPLKNVESLSIDLTEASSVNAATQLLELDAVVHLAGYIPENTNQNLEVDAEKTLSENIGGMLNLLTALKKSVRLKSFIYASSFEVYGIPIQPIIDESHATEPVSFFGASKLACEKYLSIFGSETGCSCSSLRLSGLFGAGDKISRIAANFIYAVDHGEDITIYGDGSELLDILYPGDAAGAISLCLQTEAPPVVNIGSGGHSIMEIAHAAQRLGNGLKITTAERAEPRFDYVLNIDRAKNVLGWAPQTSLFEGMREQLLWYQSTKIASEQANKV